MAAPSAQAKTPEELCKEQLYSCEDVLAGAEIVIRRQSDTISALSDQNAALKRALETAAPIVNAPEPAWYETRTFWFAVGVGVGAYVGTR